MILGPSLGLLTLYAVGGIARDLLGPRLLIIAFFLVYLVGLIPAVITAVFDSYIDGRGARGISKWLVTGCFGYVAAYLNILASTVLHDPTWGVLGAVPALICSAITDLVVACAGSESSSDSRR